jgi:hypothetical protein
MPKPFFPLKKTPNASIHGPYSSASIDVKTGSPDPADFGTTRPLIHCQVLAIRAMFGWPLAYPYAAVTAGWGHIKICQNLPAVAYWVKSLGKSHCDGRDIPTVSPTIAQIATVSHGKICRIWTTNSYIDGCGLSLYNSQFVNRKKGSAAISLGLNYCSMGLSQKWTI